MTNFSWHGLFSWVRSLRQRPRTSPSALDGDTLSLGVDRHGIHHTLHLKTGEVLSSIRGSAGLVPPDHIDPDWLLPVLLYGGYRANREGDTVWVATGRYRIGVTVRPEWDVIAMAARLDFRPGLTTDERNALLAGLNAAAFVARFRERDEGIFYAEYDISYAAGLSASQLLAMVRTFLVEAHLAVLAEDCGRDDDDCADRDDEEEGEAWAE